MIDVKMNMKLSEKMQFFGMISKREEKRRTLKDVAGEGGGA